MNRESLQALIIDRHFGELPPEVAELLDAHLAANADARAEAEQIHATLSVARRTVLRHPKLARAATPVIEQMPVRRETWLARAAAITFLAALCGLGGFLAGRSQHGMPATTAASDARQPIPSQQTASTTENSPWTHYRIASNPGGAGLQIVRLETRKPDTLIK